MLLYTVPGPGKSWKTPQKSWKTAGDVVYKPRNGCLMCLCRVDSQQPDTEWQVAGPCGGAVVCPQ